MTKKGAIEATYVYCVLRAPRGKKPSLTRAPRGLAGAGKLRILDADGLLLVVASAPLALYGSDAIDRGLKDLTWVGACAASHEAVVEHMTREGAVVPMKLFTLFADDERAILHIAKLHVKLGRVLDRIAGCEEWGVRILLDEARALRAASERARADVGKLASGTGFLEMKKRQHQAVARLSESAREEAAALYEELSGVAKAAVRREAQQEIAGRVLLDAVFLVPKTASKRFRGHVAASAEDLSQRGYQVTLTGPWPAYNFVGTSR